jgi:hypothetical protein
MKKQKCAGAARTVSNPALSLRERGNDWLAHDNTGGKSGSWISRTAKLYELQMRIGIKVITDEACCRPMDGEGRRRARSDAPYLSSQLNTASYHFSPT